MDTLTKYESICNELLAMQMMSKPREKFARQRWMNRIEELRATADALWSQSQKEAN